MFFAAVEGYFDRLEDSANMFRNLAGIVNRSMGGSANMNEVWPLHNDKKQRVVKAWSEEDLKAITTRANDIFARNKKGK